MFFFLVVGGREKCINEEKSLCIFIYFNAVFPPWRARFLTCLPPLDLNSVETLFSSRALPLKRRLCSPKAFLVLEACTQDKTRTAKARLYGGWAK